MLLPILVASMAAALPAQAKTVCNKGEQKFYVVARLFLFKKNATHPYGEQVMTMAVCGQPGDNETEEGIERLGQQTAGGVRADKIGIAVLNILPLKN